MTEQELRQARREKWRLDGRGLRTAEEAREFMESVGLCLLYPTRPALLAPTFLGAYAGTDDGLPTVKQAFADARARQAIELMVRLLREKTVFEASIFGEAGFLVSATAFPYLFGMIGDKNPRQRPQPGGRSAYSPLARDAFEAIRTHGAMSKKTLREVVGGEPSESALDRALNELWSRLRITRVDYSPEEGVKWDALYRWAPDRVRAGIHLSLPEALSALLSKFLEAVVAAEQSEIEDFFGHMVPKSRVKEAINALLAARELSLVSFGKRAMLQVAQKREAYVPRPRRISGS